MWFLWDLFNDVVDITTIPVRVVWKVTDKIIYPFDDSVTLFSDIADNLRDTIKTK